MFQHEFVEKLQLASATTEDGIRHYVLPNGTHAPSVTTILKQLSAEGIAAWKKRVGETEAARVSNKAKARGKAIHQICENYLLNKDDYLKEALPDKKLSFLSIRPYLEKHVTKIFAIEAPLYSYEYNTAGTVDLVCLWDEIPTVVDFKTALKSKREEYILNYIYQATIYGLMVKNLYPHLDIQQIAILIAVDGESQAQLFKYPLDKYYEQTDKFFKQQLLIS